MVADLAGLVVAHLVAAALMVVGALTAWLWPLPDLRSVERDPATFWPDLQVVHEPDPTVGPILVTITFTVPPERQEEFVAAMEAVRAARQRTGAMRWGLFRKGEAPDCFVEVYQVPSWDEHLRQHRGRLTRADQVAEERAWTLASGTPEVNHLVPAEAAP
ncbi:hypothetical protein GCM10027605_72170 [Micromonospora zhanjiangensis]